MRDRAGEVSDDSVVTVLDGRDDVKDRGPGKVSLPLRPGLYTVLIERAGAREEHVCRHAGPTDLVLSEPRRYSAVPATDTATSHEYYAGPAMAWSEQSTAPPVPAPAGQASGNLFVFLRAPEAASERRPFADLNLRLLDYTGHQIIELDATTSQIDEGMGWLAFHATVPADEYVLSYEPAAGEAASPREMAVDVFRDWQTQVFMTVPHGVSFASASVLLGTGFRPDDRTAQAVDAALTGLQNGTDLLPPEERMLLLYGKFENPMLGLVGAHTLLRAPAVEREQLNTVLRNLAALLGDDAPDVRALRVLAARRLEEPVDPTPFEHPPMLRAGLEAVLDAAVVQPDLVPRGGLLERIAAARLVDCPWSTWQPVVSRPAEPPDWVSAYVEDAALHAARRDTDLDVEAAAARASLPVPTVAEAYAVLRRGTPGVARTLEMEKLMTRTRREAPSLGWDPGEVERVFADGEPGDRIRALAVMQADPGARHFGVTLDAITGSQSAFEQYQALRVAQQMLPTLDTEQGRALSGAIVEQQGPRGHIKPGTDRWNLSKRLLADLDTD